MLIINNKFRVNSCKIHQKADEILVIVLNENQTLRLESVLKFKNLNSEVETPKYTQS